MGNTLLDQVETAKAFAADVYHRGFNVSREIGNNANGLRADVLNQLPDSAREIQARRVKPIAIPDGEGDHDVKPSAIVFMCSQLACILAGSKTDTQESDSIFANISQLVDESHLAPDYKAVVTGDLTEAQKAFHARAFKGCVVMLGAALEGVMLGTLTRKDVLTEIKTSPSPPPLYSRTNKKKIGAHDPGLERRISEELDFETCKACIHHLVPPVKSLGVDDIQSFRNAVHPSKAIKEPGMYDDFCHARAVHYIGSLKKIVEVLCRWVP